SKPPKATNTKKMSVSGNDSDDLFGDNSSDRPKRRIADSSDEEDGPEPILKAAHRRVERTSEPPRGRSPQRRADDDPEPPREPSPSRSPPSPHIDRPASASPKPAARSRSTSSDAVQQRRRGRQQITSDNEEEEADDLRGMMDSDNEEDVNKGRKQTTRESTPMGREDDDAEDDLFGADSDLSDVDTSSRRKADRESSQPARSADNVEMAEAQEELVVRQDLPSVTHPDPKSVSSSDFTAISFHRHIHPVVQLFFMKIPGYMHAEPSPFNPNTWELEPPITESSKFRAQDAIRWRQNPATNEKETNSHLIRWSDNSYSLRIGKQFYDLPISQHNVHDYLAMQYPGEALFRHIQKFDRELRPTMVQRPKGLFVQKKEGRAKFAPTFEDPLKKQKELEKANKEVMKNRRKLESKRRTMDRTRKLGMQDLEGLSEDDAYERGNREMNSRLDTYQDEDDEGFVVSDEDEEDSEDDRRDRLLQSRKQERRESTAQRDRDRDREREREREREVDRRERELERERGEKRAKDQWQREREEERERTERKRRRNEDEREEDRGVGGGRAIESDDDEGRVQQQKKSRRVILSDDDDE
ncbi:hypothetical protein HK097_006800, partial [Rhizophlyctis rosea]